MRKTKNSPATLEQKDTIGNVSFYLPEPAQLPKRTFVGRETELAYCRAAWCVTRDYTDLAFDANPLFFRLEGPPGVGKDEIVYEIARTLQKPLYIVQGHEELTPEDLVLALAPDERLSERGTIPLSLRASPLAAAIRLGALVLFDEINRVPERALSVLASALDDRREIFSASTSVWIRPRDENARRGFRFCCALNPGLSGASHVLPDYIRERTLPIIKVGYPALDDVFRIVSTSFTCTKELREAFEGACRERAVKDLSVRQAISIMTFAMNYQLAQEIPASKSVDTAFSQILG